MVRIKNAARKWRGFICNDTSYLPPDPPILLSGNEVVPRIQTGAAGQAWFSLDKNCALHYHLMFSGMDRGRRNLMTAELQGFADYGEVPQPYDEHVHFLRSFEGETVRVHIPNVFNFSYLQIKQLNLSAVIYVLRPNRIDKPFRYIEAIYLLSHSISHRISNKTLAQICKPDIKVSDLESFGAGLGRDGTHMRR